MVDDAQTHLLPADPAALDNVAQLHGLANGDELLELLEPHVERAGAIFDSLAPDERGQLSNDPDILDERADGARLRRSRTRRRGTSPTGARARRDRCARRPRSRRSKRCCPG